MLCARLDAARRLRARGVIAAMAIMLAAAPTVAAQSAARASAPTPDSVARAFFASVVAERWTEAVRHFDLTLFKKNLEAQIGNWRSELPDPPPTIEDVMSRDPNMPREVAEYELKKWKEQIRQLGGRDNYVSREYAGVADFRHLALLSTEDAAARWLEAQDERWRLRDAARRSGCPHIADRLAESAPSKREVLGAIVRGDTAWVLHRRLWPAERDHSQDMADEFFTHVMRLRRQASTWRIIPGHSVLQGTGTVMWSESSDCPDSSARKATKPPG